MLVAGRQRQTGREIEPVGHRTSCGKDHDAGQYQKPRTIQRLTNITTTSPSAEHTRSSERNHMRAQRFRKIPRAPKLDKAPCLLLDERHIAEFLRPCTHRDVRNTRRLCASHPYNVTRKRHAPGQADCVTDRLIHTRNMTVSTLRLLDAGDSQEPSVPATRPSHHERTRRQRRWKRHDDAFSRLLIACCALIAMTAFLPPAARAGSFRIYDHSASATGQASAFTAQADDASAGYYNPAGMTQLRGVQFSAGTTLIAGASRFRMARAPRPTAIFAGVWRFHLRRTST